MSLSPAEEGKILNLTHQRRNDDNQQSAWIYLVVMLMFVPFVKRHNNLF